MINHLSITYGNTNRQRFAAKKKKQPQAVNVNTSEKVTMQPHSSDLDKRLKEAIKAAKAGSKIIMKYYNKADVAVVFKDQNEVVTEADKKSEEKMVAVLKKAFPQDNFVTEETFKPGQKINMDGNTWVIDPIDGTTNFANKLPLFTVSIAHVIDGIPQVGVIYNPVTGDLFTAVRGETTQFNGKPVKVNSAKDVHMGLISIPLINKENPFSTHIKPRRLGSAALELAFISAGRMMGLVTNRLKPWDMAAGILMIECSGGKVTNFDNQPIDLTKEVQTFVASNGLIHDALLKASKHRVTPKRQGE